LTIKGVLGQSLRLFTVQIRRTGEAKPVGTGFIVSSEGIVATCAHVLRDAGMDPNTGYEISNWRTVIGRSSTTSAKVEVVIPYANEAGVRRDKHVYQARFKAGPHRFGDDVALLQLEPSALESTLPDLTSQEVAIVSPATGSAGNEFESFGFRTLEEHKSGLAAQGKIVGHEGERSDRAPLVSMESQQVKGGMSGAPVLDRKRNLVVGIIESEFDSGKSGKDRDTCFAVDAAVLAEPDLNIPVHLESVQLAPIPVNSLDLKDIKLDDVRAKKPGVFLNDAAQVVEEWVERSELTEGMNSAWNDGETRVVGLIGFGGSGKSSLARNWMDSLNPKPDAVFWWNWNLKPNADEFFEAAVRHFTDGSIDLSSFDSSIIRARLLARLLEGGRYVFILDGLESIQHQSADRYGSLRPEPVREFLRFFAGTNHRSFCLITSRAPIVDLERFIATFRWFEVDRLNQADGMALLQRFDIGLPNSLLGKIVDDWQGHVLSLALIGGQLRGRENMMPHEIPVPSAKPSEKDRVQSLLQYYKRSLAEDERATLFCISLFRTPAPVDAVREIFPELLPVGFKARDLDSIFSGLRSRRLIQQTGTLNEVTEHPLIREYFYDLLLDEKRELSEHLHTRIGDLYSARAGEPPATPQLAELSDWIEAAYHFCRGGQYDRAFDVYNDKIEQGDERVLSWKLNAYSTIAAIVEQFFRNEESQDPLVESVERQWFLINRLGVCRMNLGRLKKAAELFSKATALAEQHNLLKEQLYSSENQVESNSNLGFLKVAHNRAKEAVRLAKDLNEPPELRDALSYQAWIAHLSGEIEDANAAFHEAEKLQAEIEPENPYVMSLYGIWHADHLRRTGDFEAAESAIRRVLAYAEAKEMLDDISQCWRLLGDLASARADHKVAEACYAEALKLARNMSEVTVLLEALLARGRWAASVNAEDARSNLEEALHYACGGLYGLYETDVRIGLARLEKAEGNRESARKQAKRAYDLAANSNYFWARNEANALLAELIV